MPKCWVSEKVQGVPMGQLKKHWAHWMVHKNPHSGKHIVNGANQWYVSWLLITCNVKATIYFKIASTSSTVWQWSYKYSLFSMPTLIQFYHWRYCMKLYTVIMSKLKTWISNQQHGILKNQKWCKQCEVITFPTMCETIYKL